MKRKFSLLFFLLFVIASLFVNLPKSSSDELDDITKQIGDLTRQLNDSIKATQPLESQLKDIQTRVSGIKARVSAIDHDVARKKKAIDDGYKKLEKQQKILNESINDYYIKSYYFSPLLIFLSSHSANDLTRLLAYQKVVTNKDKNKITEIALTIQDLEDRKKNLESEQAQLAIVKASLDEQSQKLDKVIGEAKGFQDKLSGQIAELSAKQQSIINSRSGGFTATIGDSDLADDYNASIKGFRESAPSGYFAVFAFGAHTHRKGMSQYGARGRAQANQDFKAILKAYYGKEPVSKDTGGTIKVSGFGEMDFEGRYLLGIAEMPSSWHQEALKAQAVAARTYAYRYKAEGKEICTTEACQVFNSGKADNSPAAWRQAVESTKGQVLEDVVTYYASTHGGYASPIGWDTTDGGGGSDFLGKSYDKLGGSPWVYKAWYTKGYSPSSDKCGRSNPWLSPEEMADIVNAALVLLKGNGEEAGRISPVTTSCWPGNNPYSMSELRSVASKYGGISSANSVSVSLGNGSTGTVTINGVGINGADFKKAFNLRAPGYLSIPQSGFAFFNIEKK